MSLDLEGTLALIPIVVAAIGIQRSGMSARLWACCCLPDTCCKLVRWSCSQQAARCVGGSSWERRCLVLQLSAPSPF